MMASEKWCGGQTGMLAVLHTWGQNLFHHPHLHGIVPAGGLSIDKKHWKKTKKSTVLVDVKELSALFQKTFMRQLREAWEYEGIEFSGRAEKYEEIAEWRALFSSIQKPWVVYAKAPSEGATQTLEYLSRYTHSVAISESRVLDLGSEQVTIQYKDYADEDDNGLPKKKILKLDYEEFISRFTKHILPSGYQKIRYYGIWAMRNRKRKLVRCQELLNHVPLLQTMAMIKALVKEKMGIDPTVCGHCGSNDLVTFIIPSSSVFNRSTITRDRFLSRGPPKVEAIPLSDLVKTVV